MELIRGKPSTCVGELGGRPSESGAGKILSIPFPKEFLLEIAT
jgi:hypothetical protein